MITMKDKSSRPEILIVDDEPTNIMVLSEILDKEYITKASTNGFDAIECVMEKAPDIILLDIMMPEMDGYEVFRRLMSNSKTKDIPVIFLTGLNESKDEIRALKLGCADYITKPYVPEIIKARIRNQVELKNYCEHMEELARNYADQLLHSERLSIIGSLTSGIGHEIANYLSIISGNSELLELNIDEMLSKHSMGNDADCLEQSQNQLSSILKAARQIDVLIRSMKTFSFHNVKKSPGVSVRECINQTLILCQHYLKTVDVKLKIQKLPRVYANEQQLEQVFVNLIKNAVDSMEKNERKILEISAFHDNSKILISIADNGPGIPKDKLESIWAPFYTTKADGKGLGLGLSIIKDIISSHNGTINAENRGQGGARFIIELPVCQHDKKE